MNKIEINHEHKNEIKLCNNKMNHKYENKIRQRIATENGKNTIRIIRLINKSIQNYKREEKEEIYIKILIKIFEKCDSLIFITNKPDLYNKFTKSHWHVPFYKNYVFYGSYLYGIDLTIEILEEVDKYLKYFGIFK